eukprot:TRINITY_DN6499_c0_g1_i1.p1 TRINITY_DN6499_c0_g1~~TRINITY_DN6499_c0_g1_i1.p1  ORF type:complete len:248 (-),score=60.62 TRINITY_DN6499_c0_g1_i1:122-865(-)
MKPTTLLRLLPLPDQPPNTPCSLYCNRDRRESVRATGKRYRHLLYEYEEIEEAPKKTPLKKQCLDKPKRTKSRKPKKRPATSAAKAKAATKLEVERLNNQEKNSFDCGLEDEISNRRANSLSLPLKEDQSEEVFAEHFQLGESEAKEEDILPYNNNIEDDLGLTIRGVKWRPEVQIEALNAEGIKLPLVVVSSTPMADSALADFPALSPINIFSPFESFGTHLNFPKTPKGAGDLTTEMSNNPSEKV